MYRITHLRHVHRVRSPVHAELQPRPRPPPRAAVRVGRRLARDGAAVAVARRVADLPRAEDASELRHVREVSRRRKRHVDGVRGRGADDGDGRRRGAAGVAARHRSRRRRREVLLLAEVEAADAVVYRPRGEGRLEDEARREETTMASAVPRVGIDGTLLIASVVRRVVVLARVLARVLAPRRVQPRLRGEERESVHAASRRRPRAVASASSSPRQCRRVRGGARTVKTTGREVRAPLSTSRSARQAVVMASSATALAATTAAPRRAPSRSIAARASARRASSARASSSSSSSSSIDDAAVAAAYDACAAATRASSATFYFATALMRPTQRERVRAIYAWCRALDEVVDGAETRSPADARRELDAIERRLRALFDDDDGGDGASSPPSSSGSTSSSPETIALADTIRATDGMSPEPFLDMIAGMRSDLPAVVPSSGAFYTLVPIRPRSRGERRSLRTLPGVSLRPPLPFNPRPRRLSTPTDAFELQPDIRL